MSVMYFTSVRSSISWISSASLMTSLRAVSYTHLTFWIIDKQEDIDAITQEFAQMPALYTVSYTHLDVYKRQQSLSIKGRVTDASQEAVIAANVSLWTIDSTLVTGVTSVSYTHLAEADNSTDDGA